MSVVSIFSGTFCRGTEIAGAVAGELGCPLLGDDDLLARAAAESSLPADKLRRAMFHKEGLFNKFSRERERQISVLKLSMAGILKEEDLVYQGMGASLIPRRISHVLSVGIVADSGYRVQTAQRDRQLSAKQALSAIRQADQAAEDWVGHLHGAQVRDPGLYDILLAVDKRGLGEAVRMICRHARGLPLLASAESLQAVEDFGLAAEVELALAAQGHVCPDVQVSARRGQVLIEINRKVIRLGKFQDELNHVAQKVPGVQKVETKPGPGFHQADVYRRVAHEMPSKVLLVDDEREFVETLSERLQMRDFGTAVVHDGEKALALVKQEEPEVMVLDLKMPGIDGIEVLKRLRQEHPEVAVIILTGHGSSSDRNTCLELGAFAYLQKPVDIEELSATMRRAYAKVNGEG
jgi:two-component system, OmpR family, response regulator CpxR